MSTDRFPQSFIDEVKEKTNIVELVAKSVQLKSAGINHKGLCPFHGEKSPSFIVNAQRQTYHCFGCGAHGNAIDWMTEHEGCTFRDAIKELAAMNSIPLPAQTSQSGANGHDQQPAIDRKSLFAAMQRCHDLFRHTLYEDPNAQDARQYVKSRALSKRVLDHFLIGAAPNDWHGLKRAFPDYETNADLVNCGLVKIKNQDNHQSRYDTFRHRLTFGVRDTRGRIVAFGARILTDNKEEAKYLNSPETPIFDKSNTLFGLFEARQAIRSMKFALVVEGYMDVAKLFQFRIDNAVAAMGTAFTEGHLHKLLQFTKHIVFAFDGDAAGQSAAWKALLTVAPEMSDDITVRFLIVPNGMDPDEFVQAHGTPAFVRLANQSPGFGTYLIDTLKAQNNQLQTPDDAAKFQSQALEIIRKLPPQLRLRKVLTKAIEGPKEAATQSQLAIEKKDQTNTHSLFWRRFTQACIAAPDLAVQIRPDIIGELDDSNGDHLMVIDALNTLADKLSTLQTQPLDTSSLAYLSAKDMLDQSLPLIEQQIRIERRSKLDEQLRSGQISEAQYANDVLSLQKPR